MLLTNQNALSLSMQAVFADDVARFISGVHSFYGTSDFLFWAPHTRHTYGSLEELVGSLYSLSASQDDIMAMLGMFAGLPESVHLPIQQAQLIKYAPEVVKLSQNRASVHALLDGMHKRGHGSTYTSVNGINPTLDRVDGLVTLAKARDEVLALMDELKGRNMIFDLHYDGGVSMYPERVLQFSSDRTAIFALLDGLTAVGYAGIARSNAHLYVNELSHLAANKERVVPFLAALGKISIVCTPFTLLNRAEDVVRLAEKGYDVVGFLHEFRILQEQYEANYEIRYTRDSVSLDSLLPQDKGAENTLLLFAQHGQQINAAVRALMGAGVQVHLRDLFRYSDQTLRLAEGSEAVARLADALKPGSKGYGGSIYFALEKGQAEAIVQLGERADFMRGFVTALAGKNVYVSPGDWLVYAKELVPIAKRAGDSEGRLSSLVTNVTDRAVVDYSHRTTGNEPKRFTVSLLEGLAAIR